MLFGDEQHTRSTDNLDLNVEVQAPECVLTQNAPPPDDI